MKKYTQKYFRELVKLGLAIDITTADSKTIDELYYKVDKIGYSMGINGTNGALFEDTKTGQKYVITARNGNLFRF